MITDEKNSPTQDVSNSHGLTEQERAELDALESQNAGATASTDERTINEAEAETVTAAIAAANGGQEPPAAVAAAVAAAVPVVETPAPAAAAIPPPVAIPSAPQDFDAAKNALRDKYDDGNLSLDEYLEQRDALTREAATFEQTKAAAEQANAAREAAIAANDPHSFQNLADGWVKRNAEFMANGLRHKAMQEAIDQVGQQNPNLTPAQIIAEAERVAFDAFGWKAPPSQAEAAANALKNRQPTANIPQTLGGAPNAGVEITGRSSFSDLDNGSIIDMERAVATMSPAELEKYLAEVDG